MGSFESKEVIAHDSFTKTANHLLGRASALDASFESAVEAAGEVKAVLQNIAVGEVVVEPPLSEEEFNGFANRASTIISLGQKASTAINAAKKAGEKNRGRGLRRKDRGFTGAGASAKF